MLYKTILACALAGAVTATPTSVKRQTGSFGGITQNGLQTGECKNIIIVFARGTTENGNVGTLTGPPFFQAVAQVVGANNLAVQGIDYPADIPGFLEGGDAKGSQAMADLVQKAMTMCPKSAVFISGYSQGGQLVHNAAKALPATVSSNIAGAIIFGDPLNGKAVAGVSSAKTKIICHQGDNICEGGDQIRLAHLTYRQDAATAADFVAKLAAAGAAPAS